MNDSINLLELYRLVRGRWLQTNRARPTAKQRAADTVPYWIILVAACLYLLSAPHTSAVFDLLTPGWGWVAPLAVEFGLLYAAFRKRAAAERNERLIWQLKALELLLFATAILVNGAGSFISVAAVTHIQNSSFADLFTAFGALPAVTQVGLIMSALAAFIIPLGALTAGEGLAHLILSRAYVQLSDDESRWQAVAYQEFYQALYSLYVSKGTPAKDAKNLAISEIRAFFAAQTPPPSPSASPTLIAPTAPALGVPIEPAQTIPLPTPSTAKASKLDQALAFLQDHPELVNQSVNAGFEVAEASGVSFGRSTYADALKIAKQSLDNH